MKEKKFKEIVSEGISDLFYIWWQELKAVVKDQGVLIFFILVPLGYPLLYTFIYTNETIREVPAVVVDNNRSTLSREYLRLVDAGPDLHIISYCADMEEAKTLMKDGKAYGIIYIPENFSRDISKGIQTRVTLYCDMSGMLYYKAMLTANTNASLAMNKQIKIERSGNTTDRQDEVSASPIEYEDVSIFNPQNGFASFLIPAVLILIIQQTLLLGIGLSAGTARETNRFRDLVPLSRHYHGTLRIVLGKSLTYFMIYIIMSVYMLCLVPQIFSLVQTAKHTLRFRASLYIGMHFLCNDLFHLYSPPRSLHDDIRVHIRALIIHFRHLMARLCHPRVLENHFMDISLHLRHQRLCANQ